MHQPNFENQMKRKLSLYNISLALILILIIGIVSMILFINPVKKSVHKPLVIMNEQPITPPTPVFRKDGELKFVRSNPNKVIATINIELADDDAEREQGLMYRKEMAENAGMLFLMSTEEIQAFWMKNTIISLDILYVDSNRRIVSIHRKCKPYSLNPISSEKPASFVVEVNAGYAEKHGIKVGDLIAF